MTMITPSYLGETIEYSSLHACRSTLEDPTGDVVWFAPGEKHWHGARPTTGVTHVAVQEKLDGKVVDWMEQVSDQQYRK